MWNLLLLLLHAMSLHLNMNPTLLLYTIILEHCYAPDCQIVTSFARVHKVVHQNDPDGAWDCADSQPLDLLLYLNLLVVTTLHCRTSLSSNNTQIRSVTQREDIDNVSHTAASELTDNTNR